MAANVERCCTEFRCPSDLEVEGLCGSVVLAGSRCGDTGWVSHVIRAVEDLPVGIACGASQGVGPEPSVESWNDPVSKHTLWQREAMSVADVIGVYLGVGSTEEWCMMELGRASYLFAKKLVVCCGEDVSGRSALEMLAKTDGFSLVATVEEMAAEVRERLVEVGSYLAPGCVVS